MVFYKNVPNIGVYIETNDILHDLYVTGVLLWLYILVLKLILLYIMVVYDVLNDIWTDVYGIYVYYQDIKHVYQYLISVFWHKNMDIVFKYMLYILICIVQ